MKYRSDTVNSIVYVGALFAILSAAVAVVLLFMSSLGMIFPRKVRIVLGTENFEKIYDAQPICGGDVYLLEGELHPGHEIETLCEVSFTDAGEHENSPAYIICDETGEDVSDMYEIYHDFGIIKISGRPITVRSPSKTMPYTGEPLYSDTVKHSGGKLVEGHRFVAEGESSIIYPGEVKIGSHYRIENEDGADVTAQYNVTEDLGTLKIIKRLLYFKTEDASKYYDGTALKSGGWSQMGGTLLEGHTLNAFCSGVCNDVGTVKNTLDVWVCDKDGNDLSHLYEYTVREGTLTVLPCPLYIKTASKTKSYDGTPLSCEEWQIVDGALGAGDTLCAAASFSITNVGSHDNDIVFAVKDSAGNDVSYRYVITTVCGTLGITPKAVTIRTGSAQKVYDGSPLVCEEYEIIAGALSADERIELSFTSLVNIGYKENSIIDYSILRDNPDGTVTDVTGNYRMSYSFGILTVTAK